MKEQTAVHSAAGKAQGGIKGIMRYLMLHHQCCDISVMFQTYKYTPLAILVLAHLAEWERKVKKTRPKEGMVVQQVKGCRRKRSRAKSSCFGIPSSGRQPGKPAKVCCCRVLAQWSWVGEVVACWSEHHTASSPWQQPTTWAHAKTLGQQSHNPLVHVTDEGKGLQSIARAFGFGSIQGGILHL